MEEAEISTQCFHINNIAISLFEYVSVNFLYFLYILLSCHFSSSFFLIPLISPGVPGQLSVALTHLEDHFWVEGWSSSSTVFQQWSGKTNCCHRDIHPLIHLMLTVVKDLKRKAAKSRPVNTTTWLDKWNMRAGGGFAKGYRKQAFQLCQLVLLFYYFTSVFRLKTFFSFVKQIRFDLFWSLPVKYCINLASYFLADQHIVMREAPVVQRRRVTPCKWCLFRIGAKTP